MKHSGVPSLNAKTHFLVFTFTLLWTVNSLDLDMDGHADNPTDQISLLPIHIQDLIAKHLNQRDRTTLACVNSIWQTVAEKQIWNQLRIDDGLDWRQLAARAQVTTCPWRKWVEALRSRPKRRGYVRSLVDQRLDAGICTHVIDLITFCTERIEDIGAHSGHISNQIATAINKLDILPRLKTLRLRVRGGWQQTLNALGNTPALTHLSLELDDEDLGDRRTCIPSGLEMPRLVDLTLGFDRNGYHILELAAVCPRLENMALYGYGADRVFSADPTCDRIPGGAKLCRLDLTGATMPAGVTSDRLVVRIANDFPTLKCLRLEMSQDILRDLRHPTIVELMLVDPPPDYEKPRYYFGVKPETVVTGEMTDCDFTGAIAPWLINMLEQTPRLTDIDLKSYAHLEPNCYLFCSNFTNGNDTLWVVLFQHQAGSTALRAEHPANDTWLWGPHRADWNCWNIGRDDQVILTSFRGVPLPYDIYDMVFPVADPWDDPECPTVARDLPLSEDIWEALRTWHDTWSEERKDRSEGL